MLVCEKNWLSDKFLTLILKNWHDIFQRAFSKMSQLLRDFRFAFFGKEENDLSTVDQDGLIRSTDPWECSLK